MAIRLQLENGSIREYRTWYSEGGGESGPEIFKTKCGLAWNKEPDLCDECAHIDCAINVTEHNIALGKFGIVLSFIGIIVFPLVSTASEGMKLALFFFTIWAVIGIFFTIKWYTNSKVHQNLSEFKDHGTINGIKACKIEIGEL